jgi:hypothetical protein
MKEDAEKASPHDTPKVLATGSQLRITRQKPALDMSTRKSS